MINIEKYIAELVGNHDCVIVPGLGAFVALATSADIHPITHKFTAPGRTLSFNAQIKVNDGLLAAEISRKEGISFQEATAMIDEYVKQFNTSLSVFKHYNCNGIGRFFYNVGGKLEFEPDFTINFSSDSFGLTDFIFKPIDRNTFDMTTSPNHRKAKEVSSKEKSEEGAKSKTTVLAKVLFILMPLVVLIGAAGVVVYNQQSDVSLGGINIFGSLGSKKEIAVVDSIATIAVVDSVAEVSNEEVMPAVDTVVAEVTPEVIEAAPVKEVKHKKPATVAASEATAGKYYIIVGAFKNESNADNLYSKLQTENKAAAKLPLDAAGFYKVAVGSFESLEAANAELTNLQGTYSGIWVKKY
ncbi:SPOR domain-containing protein [Cytophaga aurantiaca]|uniref:HU domain-containing protein n=1 Tax=Cytophaga aurantiaca TaxID=29530 RepID=UPI00038080FF|nr:SPOR domain-containing protein [Cytophaga aurantiaca]